MNEKDKTAAAISDITKKSEVIAHTLKQLNLIEVAKLKM